MKRIFPFLFTFLFLCLTGCTAAAENGYTQINQETAKEIMFDGFTDFYYTYDASSYPPYYQRYRFYEKDGEFFFYHETREGGGWPQTEEDITSSGTVKLTEKDKTTFFEYLEGGTIKEPVMNDETGDAGPWTYIYRGNGQEEYEFSSYAARLAFEEYCEGLSSKRIKETDGSHTTIYRLNGSPSAKDLYEEMRPLDMEAENCGSRENKAAFDEQMLDEACGEAGLCFIYTDGLLDDLCAIEYLGERYDHAVILLQDPEGLADSPYASSEVTDESALLAAASHWFASAVPYSDDTDISEADLYLLAPLTEFAELLKDDPALRYGRALLMAGDSVGPDGAGEEWNANADPEAYRYVTENMTALIQVPRSECESEYETNGYPFQAQFFDEYTAKMRSINENICCYDLQAAALFQKTI